MVDVIPAKNLDDLIDQAAQRFIACIERNDAARVVLTGGGAGIGLLKQLHNADIDWSKVHVFFGDERNVPVSHPDSNEGQARAALLDAVDIPEANIHGYGLGEASMEAAAESYEAAIEEFAPDGFDLHLLGMGGEGHINSLFPHSKATAETERLVVAVNDSPKPPAERVTLTFPAIARAKRVWLLVAGAEKQEAAQHVIEGASKEDWPAAGAQGAEETLLFLAP